MNADLISISAMTFEQDKDDSYTLDVFADFSAVMRRWPPSLTYRNQVYNFSSLQILERSLASEYAGKALYVRDNSKRSGRSAKE